MKKLILASGLLLLLTVTACQSKHKQGSGNLEHKTLTDSSIVKIIPEYAQGFKITYTDQACLLDIQDLRIKKVSLFIMLWCQEVWKRKTYLRIIQLLKLPYEALSA